MAKIMVVDDEPLIALVLQETLSDEGHTVTTATDGRMALRMLNSEPVPDLVVLDLNLPLLNGADVVNFMRSQPALRSIPVIIITASITPEHFPPKGTYAKIITKPFDLENVHDSVATLLQHRNYTATTDV